MKKNKITGIYVTHTFEHKLCVTFGRGERGKTYFPKSPYTLFRIERMINTRPFKVGVFDHHMSAYLQFDSED